ncbi:uncharacterized protein DUF1697 [Jejuia pallidilutea]|uniref:Uncharacterized protein DUF1697 n=2 Tax=Jejuia pallidilutea TaxID=504487 RepID=A0A362X3S6_9FLAO|nr:uncharacterized protein DUF1697 [Jejuia pallidilutea]
MAALRDLLYNHDFKKVQTYIQSDNVVFHSSEEKKSSIKNKIHNAIASHFGFEVPILVKTPMGLQQIYNDCPN